MRGIADIHDLQPGIIVGDEEIIAPEVGIVGQLIFTEVFIQQCDIVEILDIPHLDGFSGGFFGGDHIMIVCRDPDIMHIAGIGDAQALQQGGHGGIANVEDPDRLVNPLRHVEPPAASEDIMGVGAGPGGGGQGADLNRIFRIGQADDSYRLAEVEILHRIEQRGAGVDINIMQGGGKIAVIAHHRHRSRQSA